MDVSFTIVAFGMWMQGMIGGAKIRHNMSLQVEVGLWRVVKTDKAHEILDMLDWFVTFCD